MLASELVFPAEEEDTWIVDEPLAENGVAAIVFALRSRLDGSTRLPLWAATQVEEAADHLVQSLVPAGPYLDSSNDGGVSEKVATLLADLLVLARGSDRDRLKERARDGASWIDSLANAVDPAR